MEPGCVWQVACMPLSPLSPQGNELLRRTRRSAERDDQCSPGFLSCLGRSWMSGAQLQHQSHLWCLDASSGCDLRLFSTGKQSNPPLIPRTLDRMSIRYNPRSQIVVGKDPWGRAAKVPSCWPCYQIVPSSSTRSALYRSAWPPPELSFCLYGSFGLGRWS